MQNLIPLKVVKVSSNATTALIYLPREVQNILGLEKGDRLLVYVDKDAKQLVFEKIEGIQALIKR